MLNNNNRRYLKVNSKSTANEVSAHISRYVKLYALYPEVILWINDNKIEKQTTIKYGAGGMK